MCRRSPSAAEQPLPFQPQDLLVGRGCARGSCPGTPWQCRSRSSIEALVSNLKKHHPLSRKSCQPWVPRRAARRLPAGLSTSQAPVSAVIAIVGPRPASRGPAADPPPWRRRPRRSCRAAAAPPRTSPGRGPAAPPGRGMLPPSFNQPQPQPDWSFSWRKSTGRRRGRPRPARGRWAPSRSCHR